MTSDTRCIIDLDFSSKGIFCFVPVQFKEWEEIWGVDSLETMNKVRDDILPLEESYIHDYKLSVMSDKPPKGWWVVNVENGENAKKEDSEAARAFTLETFAMASNIPIKDGD